MAETTKTNNHPALFAALMGVLVCGGCGGPDLFVGTQSQTIVNGDIDNSEYSAVGALMAGGTGACTATLIGSKTVLTAAHCVEGLQPVVFYPNGLDGAGYPAERVVVHPDYVWGNESDLAVVLLENPVKYAQPMALAAAQPRKGENLTIIGYGKTAEGQGFFGKRRKTSNVIGAIEPKVFSYYGGNGEKGNVCDGDSGGPSFVQRHGREVLAGVHWTKGVACGVEGNDVRVDVFRSWIVAQAAEDLADADVVAPEVKIVEPQDGATVASSFTLNAEASDDGEISAVEVFVDEKVVKSLNQGPFTFDLNDVAPGTHQVKVVAYDAVGNESTISISVTVGAQAQQLDGLQEGLGPKGELVCRADGTCESTAGCSVAGDPAQPGGCGILLLLGLWGLFRRSRR